MSSTHIFENNMMSLKWMLLSFYDTEVKAECVVECARACVRAYVRMYVRACVRACVRVRHVCVCVCVRMRVRVYVCVRVWVSREAAKIVPLLYLGYNYGVFSTFVFIL